MKWYIGQPIVAVSSSPNGEIKKGKDYVVKGINLSGCKCGSIVLDVGIEYKYFGARDGLCSHCNNHYTISGKGFSERRFAPLDVDISELTEILTKENQLTNE